MRLTGSWRRQQDKHSRWYVELDNKETIWFRDMRCFATLKFTSEEKELDDYLNKLGPDILSHEFTLNVWKKLTEDHKNKNVTSFLMDQSIISGCGNYIKAEALYYAKISPLRKISELNEREKELLYEGIRLIPRIAYMNKGLSFRDYTDQNGNKGFQEFHLNVYGKTNVKKTKTADGRITYWDDKIQV